MNIIRLFKIKKDISRINKFIAKIQYANDLNRVINIQIDKDYAYITARIEIDFEGRGVIE